MTVSDEDINDTPHCMLPLVADAPVELSLLDWLIYIEHRIDLFFQYFL
jgi:hypothetical protein